MAPPVPRSKLSRLVLAKAKEWQDIIQNELPLLEEYDTLTDAVKAISARNEAAERAEAALKKRLADLTKQEETLLANIVSLQKESSGIETLLKTTNADVEKKVKAQLAQAETAAQKLSDDLVAQAKVLAEEIKFKATADAKDAVTKGKAEIDAYKAKLKSDISELEQHLDDLDKQSKEATAAYTTAQSQLASLRRALGVH